MSFGLKRQRVSAYERIIIALPLCPTSTSGKLDVSVLDSTAGTIGGGVKRKRSQSMPWYGN